MHDKDSDNKATFDMLPDAIKRSLRLRLESLMSGLSEDHWCASWNGDNEYYIWKAIITSEPIKYGMGSIEQYEVEEIKAISEFLGKWCVYDRDRCECTFISLGEWESMYAQWCEVRLA